MCCGGKEEKKREGEKRINQANEQPEKSELYYSILSLFF